MGCATLTHKSTWQCTLYTVQWGLTVKKTGFRICRLNFLSGLVHRAGGQGKTSKISLRRCAPARWF